MLRKSHLFSLMWRGNAQTQVEAITHCVISVVPNLFGTGFGTGFVEDTFSMDGGGRMVSG